MDLNKAKKAACILNNIDTLTKEFELFSDCVNFMEIQFTFLGIQMHIADDI